MTVLVTGATGNVGRHVVRELVDRGARVRALVRDAAKAKQVLGDGVELHAGDFEAPQSLPSALEGVEAVFLTSADGPKKVAHEVAMIDATAAICGRRMPLLVKLSTIGAESGSPVTTWHWHGVITDHLRTSGVPHVILHANFFMSNLFMAADSIRETGKIFAPAAGARIAMIDPRDVAACAAVVLGGDGHEGCSYTLTGPEAITYDDVAARLSDVLGRRIDFVAIPDDAARTALRGAGMPDWLVTFLPRAFAALRADAGAEVTDSVRRLTGREPRSFTEFARDHAQPFGRPGS